MALSDALARVDRDIERGDLGKARDRLEGLLVGYPDELVIRYRLGDIYWRLQYPERAGRHWYLFETDRPEMDAAKQAFATRYHKEPWLMLDAIRFRGGLESIHGSQQKG